MNHYERLKVTQDAPPEVIRAAYRALANRLHPDRNGGAGGADDASHDQMAELNAAYEVLIDPVLRRDYDATLEPVRAAVARAVDEAGAAAGREAGDSQLDRPWQGVPPLSSQRWTPGSRQILMGAVAGVVLVALAASAVWHWGVDEHPLDRTLTAEVVRQPGAAQADLTPAGQVPAADAAAVRRPTVDELARMSDEELVKALPALDGRPAVPAGRGAAVGQASRGPHMLDGNPIHLRVETHLVDPLAPAAPASPEGGKLTSRRP